MGRFFSFLLTFILVCTSVFVVLVILMQRPSANAGMGASLGGGAAESAFGGDTTKVLTRWTIKSIVTFFIVALALSMLRIYEHTHGAKYTKVTIEDGAKQDAEKSVPKKSTKAEHPSETVGEGKR